jgi:hypothetical protein
MTTARNLYLALDLVGICIGIDYKHTYECNKGR